MLCIFKAGGSLAGFLAAGVYVSLLKWKISPISMQIVHANGVTYSRVVESGEAAAAASGVRSPSFPMQYGLMAHHKSHVLR